MRVNRREFLRFVGSGAVGLALSMFGFSTLFSFYSKTHIIIIIIIIIIVVESLLNLQAHGMPL